MLYLVQRPNSWCYCQNNCCLFCES